jgi:ATP-dependent protease ClpP protease subunit
MSNPLAFLGGDVIPDPVITPNGSIIELYLSGEIIEAERYIKWFHIIRHSNDSDIIVIHINSPGGDAATAVQFRRVIEEADGVVLASIEGDCMSAATMIMLSCHNAIIADHSRFLIHNYSGGTIGKGGEMFDKIASERTWSDKLLRDIYKGFLSEPEITQVLDGKDFWMDKDEVEERLKKREKFLKKTEKSATPRKKSKQKTILEEATEE